MENNLIDIISNPIRKELLEFEKIFKSSLDSKVKIINTIINYIIRNKGKQFRPILCLLCAKLSDEKIKHTAYLSASTVEILHIATLIHDDVVDDAYLRRGWPTINKIWKNKLSILVGDFMFSRSLLNISKHNDMESIKILATISERLSEGEIFQIEKAMSKDMDETSYFKMISDKTASLISASCLLGLITNNSNNAMKNSIKNFGEYFGIAYQLKDDIFDVIGNIDDSGKDGHLDLKKNMLTLPYIYILSKLGKSQKKNLILKLKNNVKNNELEDLRNTINDMGGIEYANTKIKEFSDRASNELECFPDSEYKTSLLKAVEFNCNRKK